MPLGGVATENTYHYIFQCPTNAEQRVTLLNNLSYVLSYVFCNTKLVNTLLFRDNSVPFEVNIKILQYSEMFIEA